MVRRQGSHRRLRRHHLLFRRPSRHRRLPDRHHRLGQGPRRRQPIRLLRQLQREEGLQCADPGSRESRHRHQDRPGARTGYLCRIGTRGQIGRRGVLRLRRLQPFRGRRRRRRRQGASHHLARRTNRLRQNHHCSVPGAFDGSFSESICKFRTLPDGCLAPPLSRAILLTVRRASRQTRLLPIPRPPGRLHRRHALRSRIRLVQLLRRPVPPRRSRPRHRLLQTRPRILRRIPRLRRLRRRERGHRRRDHPLSRHARHPRRKELRPDRSH
mmetsp:Transcript_31023/g.65439  ORF Transcript_31023/g.65439 Transcript_31023/m.65439 type:complete len:270 (+) Transcript_31023:1460-2269(+)